MDLMGYFRKKNPQQQQAAPGQWDPSKGDQSDWEDVQAQLRNQMQPTQMQAPAQMGQQGPPDIELPPNPYPYNPSGQIPQPGGVKPGMMDPIIEALTRLYRQNQGQ